MGEKSANVVSLDREIMEFNEGFLEGIRDRVMDERLDNQLQPRRDAKDERTRGWNAGYFEKENDTRLR